MDKIYLSDVRVNESDFQISISGIDPTGFTMSELDVNKQDDVSVGVSWNGVHELVVWAFNLGYEKGSKTNSY